MSGAFGELQAICSLKRDRPDKSNVPRFSSRQPIPTEQHMASERADKSSTGGGHASENSTREAEEAASPDKMAQTRKRKRKARDGSRSHRGSLRHPRSSRGPPYAASKCAAHWYTTHYRQANGLFACNGILFNHESPRRGENFVTRKITRAAGRIKIGLQSKLFLGDPKASRDLGFAGDYAEAMWMMLQQEKTDDYVIATEELHTVYDFLYVEFEHEGLEWPDHVVVEERYRRPVEVDNSKGDARKAKKALGWKPKVGFEELVNMMVNEDIEWAKRRGHAQRKP